jgi:hypothetical protein
MALVEPPIARWQRIALSTAAGERTSAGFRPSRTIPTIRRPDAAHMRGWPASGAGIEEAPGSEKPKASATAVMVAAVPMVMHMPAERAMPLSISSQSRSAIVPAWSSAQHFQLSEPEPEPRTRPFQLPRSMGPAGTKIAGRPIEIAPMSSPGWSCRSRP